MDCGQPGSIVMGTVSAPTTTYLSQAVYRCNTGYNLHGNETLQCTQNATWFPEEVPRCEIAKCPKINSIKNGVLLAQGFNYSSTIEFTCNFGFELKGASNMTCLASGMWSSASPQCAIVSCGNPGPSTNARLTSLLRNTYNSSLTYQCHVGYEKESGADMIRCLASGKWDGQPLQCSAVACGNFFGLTTAQWSHTGNLTFGDIANFSCSKGYTLEGRSVLTCLSDGNWSSPVPQCRGECLRLPNMEN